MELLGGPPAEQPDFPPGVSCLLSCVLCCCDLTATNEQLEGAKLLVCFHSVCKTCVASLKKDDLIICPSCLLSNKADDVVDNKLLQELVEIPELDFNEMCKMHSDSPAVKYCKDCKAVCQQCIDTHSLLLSTRSHVLMDLSEMLSEPRNLVNFNCPEHPGEIMSIFCKDCETVTCRDCFLRNHRDHKYGEICDVYQSGREELAKKRARLWWLLEGMNVSQNLTKEKKEDLLKQKAALTENLNEHCARVVKLVEMKFSILEEQLHIMVEEDIENLDRILQANDTKAKRVNRVSEVFNLLTELVSDTNIMYFYRNLMKFFKMILLKNEEMEGTSNREEMEPAWMAADVCIKKIYAVNDMDKLYNELATTLTSLGGVSSALTETVSAESGGFANPRSPASACPSGLHGECPSCPNIPNTCVSTKDGIPVSGQTPTSNLVISNAPHQSSAETETSVAQPAHPSTSDLTAAQPITSEIPFLASETNKKISPNAPQHSQSAETVSSVAQSTPYCTSDVTAAQPITSKTLILTSETNNKISLNEPQQPPPETAPSVVQSDPSSTSNVSTNQPRTLDTSETLLSASETMKKFLLERRDEPGVILLNADETVLPGTAPSETSAVLIQTTSPDCQDSDSDCQSSINSPYLLDLGSVPVAMTSSSMAQYPNVDTQYQQSFTPPQPQCDAQREPVGLQCTVAPQQQQPCVVSDQLQRLGGGQLSGLQLTVAESPQKQKPIGQNQQPQLVPQPVAKEQIMEQKLQTSTGLEQPPITAQRVLPQPIESLLQWLKTLEPAQYYHLWCQSPPQEKAYAVGEFLHSWFDMALLMRQWELIGRRKLLEYDKKRQNVLSQFQIKTPPQQWADVAWLVEDQKRMGKLLQKHSANWQVLLQKQVMPPPPTQLQQQQSVPPAPKQLPQVMQPPASKLLPQVMPQAPTLLQQVVPPALTQMQQQKKKVQQLWVPPAPTPLQLLEALSPEQQQKKEKAKLWVPLSQQGQKQLMMPARQQQQEQSISLPALQQQSQYIAPPPQQQPTVLPPHQQNPHSQLQQYRHWMPQTVSMPRPTLLVPNTAPGSSAAQSTSLVSYPTQNAGYEQSVNQPPGWLTPPVNLSTRTDQPGHQQEHQEPLQD